MLAAYSGDQDVLSSAATDIMTITMQRCWLLEPAVKRHRSMTAVLDDRAKKK